MIHTGWAAALAAAFLVAGCASTATSTVTAPATSPKWSGPVVVSEAALPAGIKHVVIGTVQAEAKAGYSGGASLYPLLATEARNIGANAVVSVTGGRRVTAFSWAAPYVSGVAVRVEDPSKLKGLAGTSH